MAATYTVVFEGTLREGQQLPHVKARLIKLFRTDEARIEQIFQAAPLAIKRGLSKEMALKYQHAILQAGVACHLEQEPDRPLQQTSHPVTSAKKRSSRPPLQRQESQQSRSRKPVSSVSRAHSSEDAKKATIPSERICPKCGFEQAADTVECPRCGIVFARFQKNAVSAEYDDEPEDPSDAGRTALPDEEEFVPEPLSVEREGWLSLLAGAVLTGIVLLIPFLTFIFSYVKILVHEFGHAVFGWLFAYPTIPAFDFVYGGGLAIHTDRQLFLLMFVYLGFGWLFFTFRKNVATLIILGILLGLFSLCAFTEFHALIILFMGHGAELAFAGLFLYRAISGSSIIVGLERPLYAFVGIFIEALDIRFAYQLLTSHAHRVDYEAAKGGGHWMDFSRIAEEFLHVDLTAVAGFFLVCCFFPPLLVFLFYRYRLYLFMGLAKILDTKST